MKIELLLAQRRDSIRQKWLNTIFETYPADSHPFLKNRKDPFANPVGHAITRAVDSILQALFSAGKTFQNGEALEELIKIRAVQEFTPTQAVHFILLLKTVLRNELDEEIADKQDFQDLLALESDIDRVALAAFDAYMQARQTLFDIRIRELKSNTQGIIQSRFSENQIRDGNEETAKDH